MPMPQRGEIEYQSVISVRLPKQEADRLRQLARADDRPIGAYTRRLIRSGLDQIEQLPATSGTA